MTAPSGPHHLPDTDVYTFTADTTPIALRNAAAFLEDRPDPSALALAVAHVDGRCVLTLAVDAATAECPACHGDGGGMVRVGGDSWEWEPCSCLAPAGPVLPAPAGRGDRGGTPDDAGWGVWWPDREEPPDDITALRAEISRLRAIVDAAHRWRRSGPVSGRMNDLLNDDMARSQQEPAS